MLCRISGSLGKPALLLLAVAPRGWSVESLWRVGAPRGSWSFYHLRFLAIFPTTLFYIILSGQSVPFSKGTFKIIVARESACFFKHVNVHILNWWGGGFLLTVYPTSPWASLKGLRTARHSMYVSGHHLLFCWSVGSDKDSDIHLHNTRARAGLGTSGFSNIEMCTCMLRGILGHVSKSEELSKSTFKTWL